MIFPLLTLLVLIFLYWYPFKAIQIQPVFTEHLIATQQKREGIDHLQILRFFACLSVFLIHTTLFVPNIFDEKWTVFGHNIIWILHSPGQMGVGIFFTLSGYLMAKGFYSEKYSLSPSGFHDFYRNRALRIIPLYLFNILIVTIFIDPRLLTSKGLVEIFQLITFTYNTSGPCNANAALWTISTEMQFYAWVPLISLAAFNLQKKLTIWIAIIITIFLGPIVRYSLWTHMGGAHLQWAQSIYTPLYGNLDCFLAGFLICPLLMISNKVRHIYLLGYALIPVFFIGGSYWYFHAMHLYLDVVYYILFFPTASTLITILFIYLFDVNPLARPTKVTFDSIRKYPLRLLEIGGLLTYGIYVWHPLVLAKISTVLHGYPSLMYFRTLSLGFILSFILASITYLCVEKTFENYKKKD